MCNKTNNNEKMNRFVLFKVSSWNKLQNKLNSVFVYKIFYSNIFLTNRKLIKI